MKFGPSALIAVSCTVFSMPSALCQSVSTHFISNGFRPVIASDESGNLHVAFEAYGQGKSVTDIYYTTSADQGAHWSKPYNISGTPGVSKHAAIVVEKSGDIDVVWADSNAEGKMPEIFFSRCSSVTHAWSEPVIISSSPGASSEPALALGPDNSINVVWSEKEVLNTSKEILYASSTDGGKTWSPQLSIGNTTGSSSTPTISTQPDGLLHTAWSDTASDDHFDIFYCQCQHGIWTKAVNVGNAMGSSAQPRITSSTGKVILTWSGSSNKKTPAKIWMAVGDAGGKFDTVKDASDTAGSAVQPTLAARGNDLTLVWTGTKTESNHRGIRGIVSSDSGSTFSKGFDISALKSDCKNPVSTIQAGNLYTVWEEVSGKTDYSLNVGQIDLSKLEKGQVMPVDKKR